ncbi:MAG: FadR/GntR family transcriptional regulator [Verrucomicrobiota bacterium]
MTLSPIKRSGTLVEEVCRRLAGEIRNRTVANEGWLPSERELAERLGVSRPVVREATKRLELQGLLEVQHGKGTRVTDKLHRPLNGSVSLMIPDAAERLRQLSEARVLIEPSLARLAAERASGRELKDLRRTHARLLAAANDEECIEADLEFHRQIALAAGNEICALLLESLAELGRESRKMTLVAAGKKRAVEHHALILGAIERRDSQAAHDAMLMHLRQAVIDIAEGIKQAKRK